MTDLPNINKNILQNQPLFSEDKQKLIDASPKLKTFAYSTGFTPISKRSDKAPYKVAAFHIGNAITLGYLGTVGKNFSNSMQIMGSSKGGLSSVAKDLGQTYLNATESWNANPEKDWKVTRFFQKATKAATGLNSAVGTLGIMTCVNHKKQKQLTNYFKKNLEQKYHIDKLPNKILNKLGTRDLLKYGGQYGGKHMNQTKAWVDNKLGGKFTAIDSINMYLFGGGPKFLTKALNSFMTGQQALENVYAMDFFKQVAKGDGKEPTDFVGLKDGLSNAKAISKFDMLAYHDILLESNNKVFSGNTITLNTSSTNFKEYQGLFSGGNPNNSTNENATIADKYADFKERYINIDKKIKKAEGELVNLKKGNILSSTRKTYNAKLDEIKDLKAIMSSLKEEKYEGKDAKNIGSVMANTVDPLKNNLTGALSEFIKCLRYTD